MKPNLSEARSYLDVLHLAIEQNQLRGFKTRLADAAGCQPSYLSQVLTGNAHLSQDQIFLISRFLGLNELETEVFLKLHARDRAATYELRLFLDKELVKLGQKLQNLSNRLNSKSALSRLAEEYYSAWYHAAIHVAVSIPQFQTVSSLVSVLGLSWDDVTRSLELLLDMKLIQQDGERYRIINPNVHLPGSSRYNTINHLNWRLFFCSCLQKPIRPTDLHYTAVHSLSERDAHKLREMMIQFIDQTRAIVEPSQEEKLVALAIDFAVF